MRERLSMGTGGATMGPNRDGRLPVEANMVDHDDFLNHTAESGRSPHCRGAGWKEPSAVSGAIQVCRGLERFRLPSEKSLGDRN